MCAARVTLNSYAPAPAVLLASNRGSNEQWAEDGAWQGASSAAEEVLRAVFAWLSGVELWAAARVCRGWRAAAESRLWRRALLPHVSPAHLTALRRARAAATLNSAENTTGQSWAAWSWRREYCLSAARWRLASRALAAGGAAVEHAALSHAGDRLALAADDASLTMWARAAGGVRWTQCWRRSEHARGWAAALAVSWAPDDARLLLAGPLVLADRWELLVLRFDESGEGRTEVRAECGAGGGCWAGPAAFLSLSLCLLAPARAVTTVWLNAADQGVQSEFAGVRSPVLRVYNEAAAHITHLLVAEVSALELEELEGRGPEERFVADVPADRAQCPQPGYWRATLPVRADRYERVVVAAVGAAGGARGAACALAVWALHTRVPPPLFATTSLAERVRAHREAQLALPVPAADAREDLPEPPPSEGALRALCTPPLAKCRLPSAIVGVEIHPNGGCVWAVCGAGAQCASLPALRPLLIVPLDAPPSPAAPHLLQPALCDDFLVTPAGQGSGEVRVVAARSGARGAALRHSAPPVAALLPSSPTHLLVLAGQYLYNTFKGYIKENQCTGGPRGQCGDSMDRVAQRISAARLARRQEYEREVADRVAQSSAASASPVAYGLAAGREVVRATDGRDYVVLPPLSHSHPERVREERKSSVELDPAKGCIINRSSHVDPCAHRPRILLEIDRSEVSKTARSNLTPRKTPFASTPNSAKYRDEENDVGSDEKFCKGSAFGPLTDWCSSRPKIETQRPNCIQPSLVEKIKQRSNNSTKEVRKFHTASFLSQNVTPTDRNEMGEVTAKLKADNHKLNQMLNDRDKLKEAGRGRNTTREPAEEVSASGQLELHAPAGGAGVRVRVSLLGSTPSASGCARPADTTCPADNSPRDPSSTYYGKCDPWLSIKNIQKKLTGCRKDSPPIKSIGDDKSVSQNPLPKEINLGGGTSPCARDATQKKRTPCEQKSHQPSGSPCHKKEKPKPPLSCGGPPTSRCSAHNIKHFQQIFVI